MTREDIIRMAREADGILLSDSEIFGLGFEFEIYQLERFAALVAAAERCKAAVKLEAQVEEAYQDGYSAGNANATEQDSGG